MQKHVGRGPISCPWFINDQRCSEISYHHIVLTFIRMMCISLEESHLEFLYRKYFFHRWGDLSSLLSKQQQHLHLERCLWDVRMCQLWLTLLLPEFFINLPIKSIMEIPGVVEMKPLWLLPPGSLGSWKVDSKFWDLLLTNCALKKCSFPGTCGIYPVFSFINSFILIIVFRLMNIGGYSLFTSVNRNLKNFSNLQRIMQ